MTDLAVFLAKLVRAQLNKETVPPIPEGVKLTEIVDIAVDHKMVYFFLVPLLTADIDEPSQKYLPAIKALIFKSMSKTLAQANELKKLIDIFEENEIINQPMKGAIMKFLYPSPEMREMGDVDILVREEDMERAMSLLQENGYIWNDDKKHDHHKVFTKAPHMYLEVHRALYDKKVDATQYEYFKDISKRNLREGCKYTYDFSKEDFYVYMIAHMAKHFYINGCGIRNLVDMHVYNQLYGAELNRAYIDVELEKCGIASFEKHISELTEIWLNGKESSPFYDNLFDYMLGSGVYGKSANIAWGEIAQMDSQMSNAKIKRWYIFPNYEYMIKHYTWIENKKFLLPVAWIMRIFKVLLKKNGNVKGNIAMNADKKQRDIYLEIYRKMDLKFK